MSEPHISGGPDAAPKATRREWIGLAVLALPCLVYAMDLTVLNLAVPAITAELQPSAAELLWIIDIYGFLVAGFLITMGTLGDRIGRRRILLAGGAAFGIASLVAAFAQSAAMLIAMRALLGIAGATLAPSTLSLIRNMFQDGDQRRFALGVWIASFSLGGAIGPLVGGVLLEYFHWGSVFLVAVPVMALLVVLGPRLLPEYRDPDAGRLDPASVGLSLAAVLVSIFALKRMAEAGVAWDSVALLVAGLIVGVAFVRRQRGLPYPLLDLALFRSAEFSAAIAAYALTCLAMFGIYIFITQYLQLVLGLSPLEAGVATMPWALGFVVASLAAPRLTRGMPAAKVMTRCLATAAVGMALLVLVEGAWGLPILVAGTVLMSLGMAPVFTVGNEIIITTAAPERAGAASALSETASEFSGALGIALFGSVGTVIYRAALDAAMPAGVPPEAARAALATLGGAVATAGELPGGVGDELLAAARGAFVDALQLGAFVAALIVAAACIVTARILRVGRPGGAEAVPDNQAGSP
jgi:DHA2 family multidrug resistance protein-like MFS transporter